MSELPQVEQWQALLGVPVTRLVSDSRELQPGDTFVAYPGGFRDGRLYIEQAIRQGANAVLWEQQGFEWQAAWQIPQLAISDLRSKVGWFADRVYGSPSSKMWTVGVTGTNGKTSTTHWIASCFSGVGKSCALIGTLGNGLMGQLQSTLNTTPEALRVQLLLRDYWRQGAEAVAMEVSSHALDQGRVNGVQFDVALLTNLSRDHLDYHGDMASYAASKQKLFDWPQLGQAILNLDDPFGHQLLRQLQQRAQPLVVYGLQADLPVVARQAGVPFVAAGLLRCDMSGLCLQIESSWGNGRLDSRLVGRFNAANLLGVLAVLLVSGVALEVALMQLAQLAPVAGRMQRLGGDAKPTVVIDYAHTPDALVQVSATLRQAARAQNGRLITVFGCGGDRDPGKRPLMGAAAAEYADLCFVTSDNPRSEEPDLILDQVVAGMGGRPFVRATQREDAIRQAINAADVNDVILLAGKGHETYQEIKGVKYPFDDVKMAGEMLALWEKTA